MTPGEAFIQAVICIIIPGFGLWLLLSFIGRGGTAQCQTQPNPRWDDIPTPYEVEYHDPRQTTPAERGWNDEVYRQLGDEQARQVVTPDQMRDYLSGGRG